VAHPPADATEQMVGCAPVSEPTPPPEQPYQLPGTQPAWEPFTLPERPMTAKDAAPHVPS
jgi:hypothetical protein